MAKSTRKSGSRSGTSKTPARQREESRAEKKANLETQPDGCTSPAEGTRVKEEDDPSGIWSSKGHEFG